MIAYFQKVFRILPEEGAKLFQFALLAALLQAGVAIGTTAADSLFLTHLGAAKLPVVYLFMPVIMVLYAPVYSILLSKFGIDRLVQLTLTVLVLGGLAFGLGVDAVGETTPWLLYAMRFYVGLWFIALYTLFWNFADDYFSILDGKRLYGVIAAGGSAGAMIGASLVTALSDILPPARLFLAWSVIALLTLPVFALLRRRFRKIEPDDSSGEPAPSPSQLLRFVLATFRTSRFALALALVCFGAVMLTALLEFLSMGVISEGKSPAELAHLLGKLHALANGLTLVINLLFFSRLVGRIGVANTTLILPLTYLAAFVFFYLQHGPLAAIVAFYAYQSILASIEYNNVNLLFNALPARVKPQLRTFVEAMCEPFATAFAGIFLLSWASSIGHENVALAGLIAACLAVATAFVVRFDYVSALATNLRRDWLNFAQPDKDWAATVEPADCDLLRAKASSGRPDERLVAVDLLWRVRDPSARDALHRLVSTVSPDDMERLRPSITFMLRREDTETLAETLLWLESDQGPADPALLGEFTAAGIIPMRRLQDWKLSRHPSELATTAVARWHSSRLEDTAEALAVVHRLLAGNPVEKRWAIRAIGDFHHSRHAKDLLRFLHDPDTAIRAETLRALRKLASPDTSSLLASIMPLIDDASPEERHLILGIAERVGDTSAITALLWAAGHFSASENRQLEALIVGLGLKTIPTVIHLLRNTSAPSHSRSVAARSLSRLAMPQLLLIAEDIIDTELNRGRDYIVAFRSLRSSSSATGDGILVLTRFYHDAAAESLEFALELLSLTGRLPDFDLIRASLSFANAKDRANAIETIQQSCPRALFRHILFLIDQTAHTDADSPPLNEKLLPVETVLRRATVSNLPLESSSAFIAFLELRLPGGADLLRSRLDKSESPQGAPWLVSLLPRFTHPDQRTAPTSRDDHHSYPNFPDQDNPVVRVAALLRSSLFNSARVLALDYLAGKALEQSCPTGTLIYAHAQPTDDHLYVVVDGTVNVTRPGHTTTARQGAVFGERVLMGDTQRRDEAISQNARILVLRGAVVARAIEIFPALGISLYRFKTIPAVE